MKILSNKEYEYLQKCKGYYEHWRAYYKDANKKEGAKLARAKYWEKNKKRFNELKAAAYRQAHPDAKQYKPRPRKIKKGE